ncbi:MAG: antibiotic biosynthesis monooxygenase family protein [Gemmatimonadaceae bacterium]
MYVVLWKFRVRQGSEPAFAKVYGPAGAWATLFRSSPGFLGTELLRDLEGARRYLTVDRWLSRESYESFRRERRAECELLDHEGEHLTDVEALVGDFTTVMPEQATTATGGG